MIVAVDPGADINGAELASDNAGIMLVEPLEAIAISLVGFGSTLPRKESSRSLAAAGDATDVSKFLHHGPEKPESKRVVETEAEAVAFVVSQACGLDAMQASSDYIQYYSGDASLLWEKLERIRSTADRFLSYLIPDEMPVAA